MLCSPTDCELCADGYVKAADGACTECNGDVAGWLVLAALVLIGFIGAAVYFSRNGRMKGVVGFVDAAFEAGKEAPEDAVYAAADAVKEKAKEITIEEANDLAHEMIDANQNVHDVSDILSAAVEKTKDAGRKCGITPKRVESFQVKARILVSLVQVISALGVVFSIPYPPFYDDLVAFYGVFSLDLFTVMPLG
eukprot:1334931-Prymnesium_polylepis.1